MLEQQRKTIDAIDQEIVKLFEKRMCVVEEVARIKKEYHLPILDEKREQALITKVTSYLSDQSLKGPLVAFYQELMRLSKAHQQEWLNHH